MRTRPLTLAALVLLLPCAATAGPPLPDNPLAGRLLFESKHCNHCHGFAGQGPGIGPDLAEGHFSGSFLSLGAALWNHVPGMTVSIEESGLAWPRLSPEETTGITAFLFFIDYLGRPGDPGVGERIFRARGCGACHSVGGGGADLGPDLGEMQRFASPLFIAQAIWNHGPSMHESMRALGVRPPTFRQGDLADISAFIRQRAPTGPQERVLLSPGNPNRGSLLFVAKGCATCHGDDGRGGDAGPDLAAAGLPRPAEAIAGTMWNHGLAMGALMRARGVGWPELSASELADLVAFLYFLPFSDPPGQPEAGAEVFARSCAGCHAPGAGGEQIGPELGGSDVLGSAPAFVAAMWNHAPIMRETILAEGSPWPELTGEDLRDLLGHLEQAAAGP